MLPTDTARFAFTCCPCRLEAGGRICPETDKKGDDVEKVNLAQKLSLFQEYWRPKIVGELNGSYVKLAKIKGEFLWHRHEHEDEMFFVVSGNLVIRLRDRDIALGEGEFFIVPRGVEHMPVAKEEVHIMLLEPKATLNTGNVQSDRTVNEQEWI